jgi:hypothetical protein
MEWCPGPSAPDVENGIGNLIREIHRLMGAYGALPSATSHVVIRPPQVCQPGSTTDGTVSSIEQTLASLFPANSDFPVPCGFEGLPLGMLDLELESYHSHRCVCAFPMHPTSGARVFRKIVLLHELVASGTDLGNHRSRPA